MLPISPRRKRIPRLRSLRQKIKLQSMFPDAPWDELLDAYLRGSELAEKCYGISDTTRRESVPDARAIEMLKHRFPGFSDNIYGDALSLGWFLSR